MNTTWFSRKFSFNLKFLASAALLSVALSSTACADTTCCHRSKSDSSVTSSTNDDRPADKGGTVGPDYYSSSDNPFHAD